MKKIEIFDRVGKRNLVWAYRKMDCFGPLAMTRGVLGLYIDPEGFDDGIGQ